jgi:2-polyprenyl-6-methoxyphenol hydroxylase-like FAD-dependent oxidoreductase
MSPRRQQTALVLGAGMAGLLCARTASDHFDRVLVLDADELPDGPEDRRAIPQGHHSHVLLSQGRALFEGFFPGLDAELEALGCENVDWAGDCAVFSSAGKVPRFSSGLVTRPCTRALLEYVVRRRVLALPNVIIRGGTKIAGLMGDGKRVIGALVEGAAEVLKADLIIDATGRHSEAPKWLEQLGCAATQTTVVDSFLGYATRLYQRPADTADLGFKGVLINTRPPEVPGAGALWPIEGNRWLITLAGTARHYPPTDEAGFRAFAASLQSPLLAEAIDRATPLGPIRGYRRTENQWRHFERLDRWPEGFVVVGDGVCAFNPVYGQGMTVAALEARMLGELLQAWPGVCGLARVFQRRIVKAIAPAWLVATGEDLRWKTTVGGEPSAATRFSHWYMSHLMAMTPRSERMVEAFLSVVHMTRTPPSLFHPRIAGPVLAQALWPR